MYNEDVKKAFLEESERIGDSYIVKQKYVFWKTMPYENKRDKDVALFDKKEILNMYNGFNLSLTSIYVIHNFLRKYSTFYSNEHDIDNCFIKLSREEIQKSYEEKRDMFNFDIFSFRDFIKRVETLKNPSDKFLMYGLFQGIRGISNCELAYSSMLDSNPEKREIWLAGVEDNKIVKTHRLYKADERLFNYAQESARTYDYLTYDIMVTEQKFPLKTDRIIKVRADMNNELSETVLNGKGRIDTRIRILLKYMKMEQCTGLDIYKFGLAYNIKKLCLDCGITDILDVFDTEEYEMIKEQYDLTNNDRNVRRMLKGFL